MRSLPFAIRRPLAVTAAVMLAAATSPVVVSAQLYTPQAFGQTFTAPTTGSPLLQQLTFGPSGLYGSPGPGVMYFLRILALTSDPLADTPLFSQALGSSFAGLTVTPNLSLIQGQQYVALVPDTRNLSGGGGLGVSYPSNSFSDGQAVVCFSGSGCFPTTSTGNDIDGFSVQFGNSVTPTPEPASVALVGTGLLFGVVGRRRGRRRR
ncbi:hypothetical protein BH09GEM1_BH09GEM1_27990 [soil metagenome]